MKNQDSRLTRFTRRETLGFLGMGAAWAASSQRTVFGATAPQFPKGAIIRTVLKDMPPEALAGPVLFHEHLSQSGAIMERVNALHRSEAAKLAPPGAAPPPAAPRPQTPAAKPGEPYVLENLDLMVDEMIAAKKDGIVCIVDGAHPDLGRSIDFMKQLSTRSGLPLVASTGYYMDDIYPPEINDWSEEQISEEMIRQVTKDPIGAFGEIGTSNDITLNERKVFRGIGKAQLATNIPIFTHTENGRQGPEQLDIFEAVGCNPHRICIGHMGSQLDPDVRAHKAICKRGAFIGFDRQGGRNDDVNVKMVLKLIDAGYADNLLFSSDYGGTAAQLKRNGGPGWGKTYTVWLPKLRTAGVKDEMLHSMMVDNPRRFLAFVPKKAAKS